MLFDRAAGILLHVTSLPSPVSPALDFGVGDLGASAHRFLEFLEQAGQRVWQVLPLGPSLYAESPYSCYSAFAGNPLLVSVDDLVTRGFLTEADVEAIYVGGQEELHREYRPYADTCDFEFARQTKPKALRMAYEKFGQSSVCAQVDAFETFCVQQRWWLDDFALFAALRREFQSDDWTTWEAPLRQREPEALGEWRERLEHEVEYEQFVQYLFYEQWDALHRSAKSKGISLFGDMPIFVAHGSADVWSHQDCFQLDDQGRSTAVAGVPPDYFSKTGQLWGNPLYEWNTMRDRGYQWWGKRLKSAFELFDVVRIDHFRGFESYWSVPASAKTAISGTWEPGPGSAPFDAARDRLGELAIVAEDLGLITDAVHELRDRLGFPGMRVLQFGFDNEQDGFHRPDHFPENSVAYTGTHDNGTIVGWYRAGTKNKTRCELLEPWLELQPQELRVHWQLLSMVYSSKAMLAVAPMQDILGLGDEARMNMPGQADGNWLWRLKPGDITEPLAGKLKQVCRDCRRK